MPPADFGNTWLQSAALSGAMLGLASALFALAIAGVAAWPWRVVVGLIALAMVLFAWVNLADVDRIAPWSLSVVGGVLLVAACWFALRGSGWRLATEKQLRLAARFDQPTGQVRLSIRQLLALFTAATPVLALVNPTLEAGLTPWPPGLASVPSVIMAIVGAAICLSTGWSAAASEPRWPLLALSLGVLGAGLLVVEYGVSLLLVIHEQNYLYSSFASEKPLRWMTGKWLAWAAPTAGACAGYFGCYRVIGYRWMQWPLE